MDFPRRVSGDHSVANRFRLRRSSDGERRRGAMFLVGPRTAEPDLELGLYFGTLIKFLIHREKERAGKRATKAMNLETILKNVYN